MGQCNCCGMCCRAIGMVIPPERIEDLAKNGHEDAKFIMENWTPISWTGALKINPYFVEAVEIGKEKGITRNDYWYVCNLLDEATNLCTIHETRPHICSGYPWYGDPPYEKIHFSADCGYKDDYWEYLEKTFAEPVEFIEEVKE